MRAWLILVAACGSTSPKPSATPAPASDPCVELRAPIEKVVAAELAEHPGGAKPIAETQREFSTRMIEACKGDAWSPDTIACFAHGTRTEDWDACPLTPQQLESLKQRLGGDDDPDAPAPAPSYDLSPDLGIAACDDYLRAIARAMQCPSLDEPARQQLREAVDHQKRTWRTMKPDDAAASCKLEMETLIKAAKIADCTL
ncbi:MAG TPA: hypothetical protein VL463_01130 [Kofleriaceae bacterium]|nr:hypothetical protein [Kofleriaceae bacterium]